MWKIGAWGASLMPVPEDNGGSAHSRYRALLDVSAALVEQPTVKAVLHSLREVLSSSVRLRSHTNYAGDDIRNRLCAGNSSVARFRASRPMQFFPAKIFRLSNGNTNRAAVTAATELSSTFPVKTVARSNLQWTGHSGS